MIVYENIRHTKMTWSKHHLYKVKTFNSIGLNLAEFFSRDALLFLGYRQCSCLPSATAKASHHAQYEFCCKPTLN